jgi:hypothetical protein
VFFTSLLAIYIYRKSIRRRAVAGIRHSSSVKVRDKSTAQSSSLSAVQEVTVAEPYYESIDDVGKDLSPNPAVDDGLYVELNDIDRRNFAQSFILST